MSHDCFVYLCSPPPPVRSLFWYANVEMTDEWDSFLPLASTGLEEWEPGSEPWVDDEHNPAWDDDDEWTEPAEPWQRWARHRLGVEGIERPIGRVVFNYRDYEAWRDVEGLGIVLARLCRGAFVGEDREVHYLANPETTKQDAKVAIEIATAFEHGMPDLTALLALEARMRGSFRGHGALLEKLYALGAAPPEVIQQALLCHKNVYGLTDHGSAIASAFGVAE